MASGMAHDFNNSLAAILGFSELLLEHPTRTEFLKTIMTAAQDAGQTVRRLRDFYKSPGDDEAYTVVNLQAIAEHAIYLTKPRWSNQALEKGIQIIVRTDFADEPLVRGNPAEL